MNEKLTSGRFRSIDEIYAFIVIQSDGEGILGMKMSNNEWMPFIGADLERVEQLKKLADQFGLSHTYEIRYFRRVDVDKVV